MGLRAHFGGSAGVRLLRRRGRLAVTFFFFVEESEGMWGREWESVEYRGEWFLRISAGI